MSLFLQEIFSWLSICESVKEINDPLVKRLQQKVSVNHLLVSRKIPQETFITCSISVIVFLFFFKPFLLFRVASLIINEDMLNMFLSNVASLAQALCLPNHFKWDCLTNRLIPTNNFIHINNCMFSSFILVVNIKVYKKGFKCFVTYIALP